MHQGPDHDRKPPVSFGILGRLTVTVGDHPVDPGPPKQRLLLASLLCNANSVVSTEQLTDTLWHADPPRTARKNLQVYVAALRKAIGGRIRWSSPGYVVDAAPEELDLLRFEAFTASGRRLRRQDDKEAAARLLGAALRCWRGPALPEFSAHSRIVRETSRLDARYLAVYEDWAEIQSALGNHAEILDTIDELVAENPFRERLGVARMTALVHCGRHAEALAHYDDVRQRMAREFGIEPSPVLTRLHRRILEGTAPRPDPAAAEASGAAPARRYQANHLPRDVPDFVGRREVVGRLGEALGDPGSRIDVAVVTGPVGVGKTAVAVRTAHLVKHRFPDGLLFSVLRGADGLPRRPSDIAAELLRQAGFPEAASPAGGDPVVLWRCRLVDRTALVVLDDAVDEATVRALLPGAGGSRVLVTSRRRLGGLEAVLRTELGAFTRAEALELLGRLSGRRWPPAETADAERVVEICGRVPLAVRIVGTKLAMMRHMGLGRYADRLADESALFDELSVGDLSVRARFDDCLRALPADCRSAVTRLGGLAGPVFRGDDVPGLTDGRPGSAGQVLARLLELNLVSVPDAPDVTAHCELYGIPSLLHRYLRGAPRPVEEPR
ncbi:winged helix-turn-helix domain-containing protein [Streptomyces sp. SCA3-4]|uniref:AfsR/SARP family transcriptional regulator n=1 Tax=Streptomyces sichuanensis TaxID=2871810 RepID=UPI001CE380CB|nr:AfsR/SARP family transcriptional regulator [Streptomyces sichuanensis]MCA6091844.1 winged helix-turn-helix domain-containing protein [Streptomyces sichuanensis]